MKLKDLKIGTLLILGFAIMFLFVILLGVVSYKQSDRLQQQTDNIYNHPLKTRRALSNLKVDVLTIRVGLRDLILAKDDSEKQDAIKLMETSSANVHLQFDILYDSYLGPREDIDDAVEAFTSWNVDREECVKLVRSGEIEKAEKAIVSTGKVSELRNILLVKIKKMDDFSVRKADMIFGNSVQLRNSLKQQLIYIVVTILLLMLIISYLLVQNIRKPIKELASTVQIFQDGNMSIRSLHDSKNEFGVLSKAFNSMLESIQVNIDLSQRATELSQIMLIEEDPHKFFASVLPTLAEQTNSQMAAIYLLSEDKKRFEHFESFGMSDSSKLTFDIESLEGEFGSVLSTRKIKTIKRIPKDTRFLFHTVSGKLVPREIISIPIISGKEVIAIISLASVRTYLKQSTLLIENVLDTLTARIEGVLSYQRIQNFSKTLEFQNRELEAQKIEMEAQSIELTEQNRELEMQKTKLHEASRLKTNFLSNMSHELRTPLNSVIALSGVLSRRLNNKIPSDEFSYLEVIERNGKHLLSLINDILDISRIESGREEIEITKFTA